MYRTMRTAWKTYKRNRGFHALVRGVDPWMRMAYTNAHIFGIRLEALDI